MLVFKLTPLLVNVVCIGQASAVFGHVSDLRYLWLWNRFADGLRNFDDDDGLLRVVAIFTANVFKSVDSLGSVFSPVKRSSFTAVIVPFTVFETVAITGSCAVVVIGAIALVSRRTGAGVVLTLAAPFVKTTEVQAVAVSCVVTVAIVRTGSSVKRFVLA